jgi:glutamate synthase (NADPH/NADH) small chain
VQFLWHVSPVRLGGEGHVDSIQLAELTVEADGALVPVSDETIELPVDLVILAIGQSTHAEFTGGKIELQRGRILIDRATGQTSHPKYFAGGDCTNGGREVVDAVADGKRAGVAMAAWLAATQQEGHHADA